MSRFALVGPTYQSEAVNADCQRCINWYVEQIESGTGASAAALYPTPGITPFAGPIGSGHVRGSYEFEGRLFVVTDRFYEVFPDGTNDGGHPYPPNDGRPVTFAANTSGQLLVCGGGQMWLFPLVPHTSFNIATIAYVQGLQVHVRDTLLITPGPATLIGPNTTVYLNGLTHVPSLNGLSATVLSCTTGPSGHIALNPPAGWSNPYFATQAETGQVQTAFEGQVGQSLGVPIEMVDFCDDFFLALAQNSSTFYSSQPGDGTTWDASFSYTVSEFAENVIAMKVLRREVWLFAGKHILPYYDAGDPLTPFQPNPAALIETGLGAEWAVTKLAGTLFWVGADERGRAIAFMAQGYTPVRVSNHAIENEWATMVPPAITAGTSWNIANISYLAATSTINVPHLEIIPGGATLAAGTTVRLSGLTAHPELNGLATVIQATAGAIVLNPPPALAGKPFFTSVPETGLVIPPATVSIGLQDAIGYGMQINGHAFWHILFPTAQKSWRFDVTTGMWAEVAFWNIFDGSFTAHPTVNHVEAFNRHLLGSAGSPYLFWTDKSLFTDNVPASPNNPIRRVRRAPHVSNELEWEFHHRLRVHLETGLGPMPPLTGQARGTMQMMFSVNNIPFAIVIGDDGTWKILDPFTPSDLTALSFVDLALLPYQTVVYSLGIDVSAQPVLTLLSPPDNLSGFIQRIPLITYPSGLQTGLSVQNGRLMIDPPQAAPVEPEVMLRWSDDGGHDWSNEYVVGAGMAGNFKRMVQWRRLGRSRDRVYEIAVSDPIPWRIIDAYLHTSPSNQQPMQRYAQQLAKMA